MDSRLRNFRCVTLLLGSLLLLSVGCSRNLGTSYGKSNGYTARRSVNGFSALREAYEDSGFRERDLTRLTQRVRNANVIVWTPEYPSGVQVKTTRWFESWLTSGNKTLVYVLPDSGSESAYYREASGAAIPSQRLEYRRKYAESLNREHQWELNRSKYPTNGWFDAMPKLQNASLVVGEDAGPIWRLPDSDDTDSRSIRSDWALQPYQKSQPTTNNNNAAPTFVQPTGPGSGLQVMSGETTPSKTQVDFTPLIQTTVGDTVVAKITSKRWRGSQIIVVASGSLLTNYGLTSPVNRQLATSLINASFEPMLEAGVVDEELLLLADGSEPQAAFAFAPGQFPISERVDGIPRATGAELLTIYPMSLVTMHLAVIGLVICLMLLPTFGRPRTIERRALTHFGDHLDAVGTLMQRRGGESFARRRISEYMKRVRGETSGKWVLVDERPKIAGLKPKVVKLPENQEMFPSKPNNPSEASS